MSKHTTNPVDIKPIKPVVISKAQQKRDTKSVTDYADILVAHKTVEKEKADEFRSTIGAYLTADASQLPILEQLLNDILAKVHCEKGKALHNSVKVSFKNNIDNVTNDDPSRKSGKSTKADNVGYVGPQMSLVIDKTAKPNMELLNSDGKGYKSLIIAERGTKVESTEDLSDMVEDAESGSIGNAFEYLERSMLVSITKIKAGDWDKLDPAMAATLEEMLDACRSTPILDINKAA